MKSDENVVNGDAKRLKKSTWLLIEENQKFMGQNTQRSPILQQKV